MSYQSIERRLSLLELEHTPQKDIKYCWIDTGDNKAEKMKAMQAKHPNCNIVSIGWNHE